MGARAPVPMASAPMPANDFIVVFFSILGFLLTTYSHLVSWLTVLSMQFCMLRRSLTMDKFESGGFCRAPPQLTVPGGGHAPALYV